MLRILLIWLSITALPLAAQARDSTARLRSGSTVRLVLRSAPLAEHVGAILGRSGDSLRVIGAGLGLARVAIADVERLDAESSLASSTAIVIAASAAAGTAIGVAQGEGFLESLALGTATAVVFAVPGNASDRNWRRVDPAAPWRNDPVGARVRVSAPGLGFADAELRLLDFRSGTLYFREGDALTASPVGEITKLELSLGHQRRRGARIGSVIGGIAGMLYAGSFAFQPGAERVGLLPAVFIGFGAGSSVGAFGGYVLAPREWKTVPLGAGEGLQPAGQDAGAERVGRGSGAAGGT